MNEAAEAEAEDVGAAAAMFDEERLQSRLALMRRYIARPIPKQPWDDRTPAFVPFRDGDDVASGGGVVIAGARHASNIPLLKSMNVTAVLNCASGVSHTAVLLRSMVLVLKLLQYSYRQNTDPWNDALLTLTIQRR